MNITLNAPINKLSYGYVSTYILKELSKNNTVSLFPIGNIEFEPQHKDCILQALDNAKSFDYNAPCIRIYHQFSLAEMPKCSKRIGFPIFELDTFKHLEKHHLSSCDELFVCSSWAKEVCINNGITIPIHVVPLGVDTKTFVPSVASIKTTTFLNIGKWEIRKGHDILIEAFKRAFSTDAGSTDDVLLIMCCENPFLTVEGRMAWERTYKNPKIRIVPRLQKHSDVAKLMSMADCGIFPSRAEGWNLEALEMLASGKKLIITDYSAHTEFCSSDNAMLVDIDDVEPAVDNIWFRGEGNWAKIEEKQINQIALYMRQVHAEKIANGFIANDNGVATASKFTWDDTTRKILGAICQN